MTIAIDNSGGKVLYTSNGVATNYVFSFKVLDINDIEIYEDGVLTVLAYTVNLNADQDASPGGSIDYDAGVPSNLVIILIKRVVDIEQQTDYTIYGGFPPETHELALDNLTQIVQQLEENVDRSLLAKIDDDGTTDFTLPSYTARRALVWDLTLKKLVNSDIDPDAQAVDAAASATASAASATASAASATASAASAVAADNSFILANTEAISAQFSSVSAAADAIDAGNSASAASSSATAANTDAANANTAASASITSANAASNSETNSSFSESAASLSETNASTSETNAGNSATAAAASAASAGAAAGIIINFPVTGGTTTAYTATLGIAAYGTGITYRIQINATNTSSTNTTLNIDGIGVRTIRTLDGIIIAQGHMVANAIGEFYYNGVEFFLVNPAKLTVAFRVNGTGTELANITGTQQLLMSVKAIDTHSFYDNVTNFRFNPKVAGYYSITAQLMWFSVVSGDGVILYLYQNGAQISESFVVASSNTEINNITRVVFFNGTTDYLDIRAANFARDTADLQISGIQTWLEGHLI